MRSAYAAPSLLALHFCFLPVFAIHCFLSLRPGVPSVRRQLARLVCLSLLGKRSSPVSPVRLWLAQGCSSSWHQVSGFCFCFCFSQLVVVISLAFSLLRGLLFLQLQYFSAAIDVFDLSYQLLAIRVDSVNRWLQVLSVITRSFPSALQSCQSFPFSSDWFITGRPPEFACGNSLLVLSFSQSSFQYNPVSPFIYSSISVVQSGTCAHRFRVTLQVNRISSASYSSLAILAIIHSAPVHLLFRRFTSLLRVSIITFLRTYQLAQPSLSHPQATLGFPSQPSWLGQPSQLGQLRQPSQLSQLSWLYSAFVLLAFKLLSCYSLSFWFLTE